MDDRRKLGPPDFASYLHSMIQLGAIERVTQTLDCELADSRRIMVDLQTIFNAIPSAHSTSEETINHLSYEDISNYIDADAPNLLLPEMAEKKVDVDVNAVIATMKGYAEELKKKIVHAESHATNTPKEINSLDLEQYASCLDQLSQRLSNMKLNTKDDIKNRNPGLEIKLMQLCQDVNMFTQMVQSKTTLSKHNKNFKDEQQDNSALYYDNIINKLLSGINEVTYMMKSKN